MPHQPYLSPFLLAGLALTIALPAAAAKQGDMSDLERAHRGTVEIDTELLNRAPQPAPVQAFFAAARQALGAAPQARFADVPAIRQAAETILLGQAVCRLHVVEEQENVPNVKYGGFYFHGSWVV